MTDIISDEALAAIKAGLEWLPSGGWAIAPHGQNTDAVFGGNGEIIAQCAARHCNRRYEATIEHIARMDPQTVAAIIARLEAAEAENKRLREALRPFGNHYQSWMDHYADHITSSTFPIHTIGDLRRARAALEGER